MDAPRPAFLRWWLATGVFCLVGGAAFLAGDVYERVYLPWRAGVLTGSVSVIAWGQVPHVLGILAFFLCHGWIVGSLAILIYRRSRPSVAFVLLLALMILAVGARYVPFPTMAFATIKFLGPGPRGDVHLVRAAGQGDERLVRLLLDQGLDINTRVASNVTPLHAASRQGHDRLVEFLLEHGANVDASRSDCGGTPLIEASFAGQAKVVELLLSHGADPLKKDCNGKIAAAHAGNNQVEEVFRAYWTRRGTLVGRSPVRP